MFSGRLLENLGNDPRKLVLNLNPWERLNIPLLSALCTTQQHSIIHMSRVSWQHTTEHSVCCPKFQIIMSFKVSSNYWCCTIDKDNNEEPSNNRKRKHQPCERDESFESSQSLPLLKPASQLSTKPRRLNNSLSTSWTMTWSRPSRNFTFSHWSVRSWDGQHDGGQWRHHWPHWCWCWWARHGWYQ